MKFELEPLITDKKGNEFSDYKIDEFYKKMFGELLSAHSYANYADRDLYAQDEAMALLKVMTTCVTRLFKIRHDCDYSLDYLQKKLIRENEEEGYFNHSYYLD